MAYGEKRVKGWLKGPMLITGGVSVLVGVHKHAVLGYRNFWLLKGKYLPKKKGMN